VEKKASFFVGMFPELREVACVRDRSGNPGAKKQLVFLAPGLLRQFASLVWS